MDPQTEGEAPKKRKAKSDEPKPEQASDETTESAGATPDAQGAEGQGAANGDAGNADAEKPDGEKPQKPDILETRGYDRLKVQLRLEQKIELGEEIAGHHARLDELDAELASEKERISSEMKRVRGELRTALTTLRDSYTYDQVAIVTQRDFRTGELRKVRTDTGEIYSSRPLTGEERQSYLFDRLHRDVTKSIDEVTEGNGLKDEPAEESQNPPDEPERDEEDEDADEA